MKTETRQKLLEGGLAFLVGSGIMIGIQRRVENQFRNAICDGYNGIMYVMKPIAESLGNLEQIPPRDIEQPVEQNPLYLVQK